MKQANIFQLIYTPFKTNSLHDMTYLVWFTFLIGAENEIYLVRIFKYRQ